MALSFIMALDGSAASIHYGDLVYLTARFQETDYIVQYCDHHPYPSLCPVSSRRLIGPSLFQIKEEVVHTTDASELDERIGGTLVYSGSRITLLHVHSHTYLDMDLESCLDAPFAGRRTVMRSTGLGLSVRLKRLSREFQREIGEDPVSLTVDETSGFFCLNAAFSDPSKPLYCGFDTDIDWQIHVLTPYSQLKSRNIGLGTPFCLYNRYAGMFLASLSPSQPLSLTEERNLTSAWVLSDPENGKIRLQHVLSALYLTSNGTLGERNEAELVELSTFPMTIDQFVRLKLGNQHLKVETGRGKQGEQTRLPFIAGLQRDLETSLSAEVEQPDLYEFEAILLNSTLTDLAFKLIGITPDIVAYLTALQSAYIRRAAGLDPESLPSSRFTALVASLRQWLSTAESRNSLDTFMQTAQDVGLLLTLAEVTTLQALLQPYGLEAGTAHISFQQALYGSNTAAWRLLEQKRMRELVSQAPRVWEPILIDVFSGVHCSTTVALQTIHTLAPSLSPESPEADLNVTSVKCLTYILGAMSSHQSGLVSALRLSHVPLRFTATGLSYRGRDLSVWKAEEAAGVVLLYAQLAKKGVSAEVTALREIVLGEEVGEVTALDKVLHREQQSSQLPSSSQLSGWSSLIRLNSLLKYRSGLSSLSVPLCAEVMSAGPYFLGQSGAGLKWEWHKWDYVREYLDRSKQGNTGLLEYTKACLSGLRDLVAGFLLGPEEVGKVVLELYAFLTAFAGQNFPLQKSWTKVHTAVLSDLVTGSSEGEKEAAKCFGAALEGLKVCLTFFKLKSTTSVSKSFIKSIITGKVELLPTLLRLLLTLVRSVSHHSFISPHLEQLAFLIGTLHTFKTPIGKLSSLAEQPCRALVQAAEAVVSVDLLWDWVADRPNAPDRLEAVKTALKWLDSTLMAQKLDPDLYASTIKLYIALGIPNALIVLLELLAKTNDWALGALVLRLTRHVCAYDNEYKCKVIDQLAGSQGLLSHPDCLSLLCRFSLLSDLDTQDISTFTRAMIAAYTATKGTQLEALRRVIARKSGFVPLAAAATVLLEALEQAKDREVEAELGKLLREIGQKDGQLQSRIAADGRFIAVIGADSQDFFTAKAQPKRSYEPVELFLESTSPALSKSTLDLTLARLELPPSVLTVIPESGSKAVLQTLEAVNCLPAVIASFQGSSSNLDLPMYTLAEELFKEMVHGHTIRGKAVKTFMKSEVFLDFLHLFIISRPPRPILLKYLTYMMQINTHDIKARILSALLTDKVYFFVLSGFARVCEQYKNEVWAANNPHYSALEGYINFFAVGCDLCNTDFQDFVRMQMEGAETNLDILQSALELLSVLIHVINHMKKTGKSPGKQQRKVVYLLISFLTEAITGPNAENQRTVGCSEALYQALNTALEMVIVDVGRGMVAAAILALLRALLESDSRTHQAEIIKTMTDTLNISLLERLLLRTHQNPSLSSLCIKLCIFFCDIRAKASAIASEAYNPSAEVQKVIQFYIKSVRSVEIEKEGTIYGLLFPLEDSAQYLTDYTREQLLKTVQKQPLRQEKLDDLLSGVKTCAIEIAIQQNRKSWVVRLSPYWLFFSRFSFVFAMIINFILLFSIRASHYHDRFHLSAEMELGVWLLGVGQFSFYVFSMFLYWNTYYYTLFYPLVAKGGSKDVKDLALDPELNRYKSPYAEQGETISHEQVRAYQSDSISFLLYHLGFAALSLCAIFYQPLYALLLLGVFSQNERFDTIIKALRKNWVLLGVTALLMAIVVYQFAMIAYLQFHDYYNQQVNLMCDDLFNCFISTLNVGLAGGLGDQLAETREEDYWPRLFFDLAFQIIITMVFLNVVFGIIIDAFGDLRDERTSVDQDVNNNCLICGRDRSTIDLRGESWKRHVTEVHSYTNYLHFMLYIRSLRLEDCSGLEKYVKDLMDRNSVGFLPHSSAMLAETDRELERAEQAEERQIQAEMIKRLQEAADRPKDSP